jgi:hypothetical protein
MGEAGDEGDEGAEGSPPPARTPAPSAAALILTADDDDAARDAKRPRVVAAANPPLAPAAAARGGPFELRQIPVRLRRLPQALGGRQQLHRVVQCLLGLFDQGRLGPEGVGQRSHGLRPVGQRLAHRLRQRHHQHALGIGLHQVGMVRLTQQVQPWGAWFKFRHDARDAAPGSLQSGHDLL